MWARRGTCIQFMAFSRTRGALHKISGEKKSRGKSKAMAEGLGWWAFGLVEARWRLPRLPGRWKRETRAVGGEKPSLQATCQNLLPPKLATPLQFY